MHLVTLTSNYTQAEGSKLRKQSVCGVVSNAALSNPSLAARDRPCDRIHPLDQPARRIIGILDRAFVAEICQGPTMQRIVAIRSHLPPPVRELYYLRNDLRPNPS